MAEIRPISAWRYNPEKTPPIDDLVSPLFDVVSEKQRKKLYDQDYNSIHLSVPRGDGKVKDLARRTLQQWKVDGIIRKDHLPGIYAYYQYFTLPGSPKEFCRKGFISNIKIADWEEKIILRHESTMPHSVSDRKDILNETQLNISPTHGLYTDANHLLEPFLDECINNPIYEVEDYQGVRDVLGVIHDAEIISKFVALIKDKQIILADGHHRYEGSLQYQKEESNANPDHNGQEGYNFHLMYLTNTESDDLRILPTHRLVHNISEFSEDWLLKQLDEDFVIKELDNAYDVNEIILGKKWAFGLLVNNNAYKIRLKAEKLDSMAWNFPKAIKELDLTVMHYFIFEKIIGIKKKNQVTSDKISFQRNFTECLSAVNRGDSQFALITKDIPIETVKQTCYSGYTLPQKSTYFYPKVISGFLFSSIQKDEFNTPFDSRFQ
jgi:uncharacterized protein (DUF1015 family)